MLTLILYQLQQSLNANNYQMVLHIGDMAYNLDTDDGEVGDNFMNKIQSISSVVPYMTCPGNHESPNNSFITNNVIICRECK